MIHFLSQVRDLHKSHIYSINKSNMLLVGNICGKTELKYILFHWAESLYSLQWIYHIHSKNATVLILWSLGGRYFHRAVLIGGYQLFSSCLPKTLYRYVQINFLEEIISGFRHTTVLKILHTFIDKWPHWTHCRHCMYHA